MGERFTRIDGQLYRAWPVDKDEVLKEMTERMGQIDGEISKLQDLKSRLSSALADLRSK